MTSTSLHAQNMKQGFCLCAFLRLEVENVWVLSHYCPVQESDMAAEPLAVSELPSELQAVFTLLVALSCTTVKY